jgi:Protein of unknown function (DUF3037)
MNSNIFTYSLLRYVHSASSGEALNVGILFIFPEQKQVVFLAPTKLTRLSHTYQNFSEWLVKAHLKGMKQKAQQVSNDWNLFSDEILKDQRAFIAREFLLEDATALQFSDLRVGVLDTDDYNGLAKSYYELYFRDYEEQEQKEHQRNEKYISQKLYRNIIAKSKDVEQYLQKDIIIESPELTLKFEYAWQNHQKHLVRPLSFDIDTPEGIQEKSARNFGYLTLLNQTAKDKNYTFDILVSRPSSRNLFASYDKALRVLESVPTSKKIIEESQFDDYSGEIVGQIVRA